MRFIRFGTDIGEAPAAPLLPFYERPVDLKALNTPPPPAPPPQPRPPHWTDKLPRNLVSDLILDRWEAHKKWVDEGGEIGERLRHRSNVLQAKAAAEAAAKLPPAPPAPPLFPLGVPGKVTTIPNAPFPPSPPEPQGKPMHAGNIIATGIVTAWDKLKETRKESEEAALKARLETLAAQKYAAREAQRKTDEAIAAKKAAEAKAAAEALAAKKAAEAKAAAEALAKKQAEEKRAAEVLAAKKAADAKALAAKKAATMAKKAVVISPEAVPPPTSASAGVGGVIAFTEDHDLVVSNPALAVPLASLLVLAVVLL